MQCSAGSLDEERTNCGTRVRLQRLGKFQDVLHDDTLVSYAFHQSMFLENVTNTLILFCLGYHARASDYTVHYHMSEEQV